MRIQDWTLKHLLLLWAVGLTLQGALLLPGVLQRRAIEARTSRLQAGAARAYEQELDSVRRLGTAAQAAHEARQDSLRRLALGALGRIGDALSRPSSVANLGVVMALSLLYFIAIPAILVIVTVKWLRGRRGRGASAAHL